MCFLLDSLYTIDDEMVRNGQDVGEMELEK